MNTFGTIVSIISGIMVIIGFVSFLAKPIREKLLKTKETEDGIKCMLRSQILDLFYKHEKDKTLRQHERENLDELVEAYQALKGNSFIIDIYAEMRKWTILP